MSFKVCYAADFEKSFGSKIHVDSQKIINNNNQRPNKMVDLNFVLAIER